MKNEGEMKNEIRTSWKVSDGILKLSKYPNQQVITKFFDQKDLQFLICDLENEDQELISQQGKMMDRIVNQLQFYHGPSYPLKPQLTVFVTNLN